MPQLLIIRHRYGDRYLHNGALQIALHTQIRKPVMNRNTHGEKRRKVDKATSFERIGWIESFVGQLRLLVKLRHHGEDTICRSRA
ncbi:hypothetical protein T11_18638 [Trichinella zimbabwensis]|uniref:Uncharacterized protein n=1 Tax=Trichinella zimbabwensis TaxID=268475 RepID=A0A0V1HH68_9BILA|nr:hypothetical protein T11_18638 [Trichinella zimbabwensis]